jgi:hypothetical protein
MLLNERANLVFFLLQLLCGNQCHITKRSNTLQLLVVRSHIWPLRRATLPSIVLASHIYPCHSKLHTLHVGSQMKQDKKTQLPLSLLKSASPENFFVSIVDAPKS